MTGIRKLLTDWPSTIQRTGMIITSFGETVPFCNFLLNGELILLERKTPDASGARRVIMNIDGIKAIKILDAIEMPRFKAMGFEGVLEGQVR